MDTHRLEMQRWKSFFDAFSRSHEGWVGSLEVHDPGKVPHPEVDGTPFRRANLEIRDGRDALVLTFGEEPEEHFAYIVRDLRALRPAERADRSEASLLMESANGSRCLLLLVNPVHDEMFAGH